MNILKALLVSHSPDHVTWHHRGESKGLPEKYTNTPIDPGVNNRFWVTFKNYNCLDCRDKEMETKGNKKGEEFAVQLIQFFKEEDQLEFIEHIESNQDLAYCGHGITDISEEEGRKK